MSPSCPWLVSQARARLVPSSIFEDNRESYISRLCRCSFLCKFPFFCFQFPFLSCFLLPAFPVAHWYPPCHLLLLSSITGVVLCFTHKSSSSSFLYSSLTMLSSCTSSSSISISELVVIYHNFSIANYSRPQCLPFLTQELRLLLQPHLSSKWWKRSLICFMFLFESQSISSVFPFSFHS